MFHSEECFKSLSGRPFWRDLHPEVLQNFVVSKSSDDWHNTLKRRSMKQYALYDTEEGTVKLKCPKEEEHVCCTNV